VRHLFLLVSVVLVAALALVVTLDPFGDPGAATDASRNADGAAEGGDTAAVLAGRGGAAGAAGEGQPDPFADETDLKTLLLNCWSGNEAYRRLLELARADATVIEDLVAWLRPERDADRTPWLPAGQSSSIPVLAARLFDLYGILAELAPASLPPLVAALSDEDPVLRRRVAAVLERTGENGADAVPALLARLEPDAEDAGGQAAMLRALAGIGVKSDDVAAAFRAYLGDAARPDLARAAAADGFPRVTGPTPATLAACASALRDQSYEVCTRLIPNLALWGTDAEPLRSDLLALVLDPTAHGDVRRLASEELGRIGTPGHGVGDTLLSIVFDEGEEEPVRRSAAAAIGTLGGETLDRLLRRLAASDTETLCFGVSALGQEGTVDAARLLALLDPLRSSTEEDRSAAFAAGTDVTGDAAVLVPWFARWLEDGDADTCGNVIGYVARLEDAGGSVVDLLASLLRHPNGEVRYMAMEGLVLRSDDEADYGDKAAQRRRSVIDAVRACLADPVPDQQLQAAVWISRIAPIYDEEALPVWIHTLESGSYWADPLPVLKRLGPKARAALPALENELATARHPSYRTVVQETIDAIRGR